MGLTLNKGIGKKGKKQHIKNKVNSDPQQTKNLLRILCYQKMIFIETKWNTFAAHCKINIILIVGKGYSSGVIYISQDVDV